MSVPAPRHTLPREARIRSGATFRKIFALRRHASDRRLTLYMAPNDVGSNRLGLAVGRHFGNAVRRNQAKRLLREAFRQLRNELPGPSDWVIIPKPNQEPSLPEIKQSILRLARCLLEKADLSPDSQQRKA